MKTAESNPFVPPTNDMEFSWLEVRESINEFNERLSHIKQWDDDQYWKWSPEEVLDSFDQHWGISEDLEALAHGEGGETGAAGNPAAGQHLGFWINQNFGYGIYKKIQDIHKLIADIASTLSQAGWDAVSDWDNMSEEDQKRSGLSFLTKLVSLPPIMEEYSKEINKLFKQIYPERFKYDGFIIDNPDHFAKPLVNDLLVGINILKAFFKDTGLLKIFEKEIKSFRIAFTPYDHKNWHGLYEQDLQRITIYHLAASGRGRLLKNWIKEVFIHEFGHHIHLKYLHGIAQDFWNSWWDLVKDASQLDHAVRPITHNDRMFFYSKMIEFDGDPRKAMKDLPDIIEQYRFIIWLNNPSKGNKDEVTHYLNLTGIPKLTKLGQDIFSYFKDPWDYIEKHHPEDMDAPGQLGSAFQKRSEELEDKYRTILGIQHFYGEWPVFGHKMAGKDVKKLLSKAFNSKFSSEVAAINSLAVPSDYARTNVMEDFAETFVSFVTNPRSLSDLAQYRMKRTLSLSGLYGKPVMTFASVVEELLDRDMDEEARAILEARLKETTNEC